ncbi:hypothetical protein [Streptomyces sp. NPDC056682]|uniref:hypothetical protein n=1 Tax=Streptomyces sp. NPDC056682 TaxID=3345909 RepID=UPI0036918E6B
MFLSLSTSAWLLISASATVVNLAAMQWIIQIPTYRKQQFWLPVIGLIGVGVRGLAQSHTLDETLFLYSAVMVMFPVMLAPVRRQITRDYYRWVEDPTTKASKAATAWIATSMTIMMIAIAVAWSIGRKNGV